ncbi:toll/interleukin-1 receptor domain-containing protein [Lutibacter citreus]|uniref:toll/interleukin-1 receptor domain-containing protein n=1 Tax=Lutibacter citreus TaxID=2138210 RepID=UPI000DBE77E6|nr:toll/interleukin-1 receptor domain-containing protein [Lutibacter citreus]
MKYNAFISYSHGQDFKLAPSLETALEKFAKPTFKRKALNIFRDSNDLSISPDLWGKIEDGLNTSEYFIFLASPLAAQSHYCKKEVTHWIETKSISKFLIVLTDGELIWDQAKSDFDWSKTTAVPKNLSGVFKNEPLYVDFRENNSENLTLDNPDFKNKLVLIAATLHKKTVGDMVGEAVKQHKRTMRIRNAAIGILSALLVAAILLSIYATKQKNIAKFETKKALLSTYIASSQAQLNEDPTKSLRLAEYAYRYANKNSLPTKKATEQLIKVVYSGYGFYQEPNLKISSLNVKKEHYNEEIIGVFKQNIHEIINEVPSHEYLGAPSTDIVINPLTNETKFLIAGGKLEFPELYNFTNNTNTFKNQQSVKVKLEGFSGFTGYFLDVAISSDGLYSVLSAANSKTALIDNNAFFNDLNNSNIFKTRAILKTSSRDAIFDVDFTENNNYIITKNLELIWINSEQNKVKGTKVNIWKTTPFPYIEIFNSNSKQGNSSISGVHYITTLENDLEDYFKFHNAQTLKNQDSILVAEFPNAIGISPKSSSSSNGDYLVNYQGVFNKENELLITLSSYFIDNSGVAYCFSKDGKFFKLSYLDGPERIFALDPTIILNRINDTKIMGSIATLNSDDKKRFLIE